MKILSFIKILSIIVLMSLSICSFTGAGRASGKSDHGWVSLFNGKDLKGWDTYLGPESDSTGKRVSDHPIGLNKFPRQAFTALTDDTAGHAPRDEGATLIPISP